jgi:hypothetical protein
LWGADVYSATFIVGGFGDGVLIYALIISPVPVLDIMAGNRLSPAEHVLQTVYFNVSALAWLSVPIWLIGLWASAVAAKWAAILKPDPTVRPRPTIATWMAGFIAAGFGTLLCFQQQPRWQNSTAIVSLVSNEDYQAALNRLNKVTPGDFPPHWELPPNPNYFNTPDNPRRLIRFFVSALNDSQTADWVRLMLQEKVMRGFASRYIAEEMLNVLPNDELERIVETLEAAKKANPEFPHGFHSIPYPEPGTDADRAALLTRLDVLYRHN